MRTRTMRVCRSIAIAVCFCVSGCVHVRTSEDNARFDPYGPLDPPRRELLTGSYRAYFFGNNIIVMASGSRPYTGWKISLALEGHRNGKPVLALYGEDPGAGGAAITPFLVSRVLRPAAPGPNVNAADNAVLIRDAHGVHEVAVEVPHK